MNIVENKMHLARKESEKEIELDPHSRWIQENFNELRKYPNMFVALDPKHGALISAINNDEFAKKLDTLSSEENERVSLFHTSMYGIYEENQ